jgi:hypothetical protein
MDRQLPSAAPVSQDGTDRIDAEWLDVPSPDVPTSLGLVVREYLKSLRPRPELSRLSLHSSKSSAADSALFTAGDGSPSPANGSWPQRGVHPKSRFCLISSATAGGT